MDKMTAGLLGAVAGLATMSAAQAATTQAVSPSQALQASSYADLLEPIPNAVALLKADDGLRAEQMNTSASFQLADWGGDWRGDDGYNNDHHHHHHHRRYDNYYGYYNRGGDHHHHHHHHHNYGENNFVGIPGVGGFVVHHGD